MIKKIQVNLGVRRENAWSCVMTVIMVGFYSTFYRKRNIIYIYIANRVVNDHVHGGDTANIAALDIAKAFDKVNHYGILVQLAKRRVPVFLLNLFEAWLLNCSTCVKWQDIYSDFFVLYAGVRQGSVLSPAFFALYIDEVISKLNKYNLGLTIVYADDILLISRSISGLQAMFDIVQTELRLLLLSLNVEKCHCLRIGPRFDRPFGILLIVTLVYSGCQACATLAYMYRVAVPSLAR